MTESILAPIAALTLPDSAALSRRAEQALAFIEDFEIATAEEYALAADELKAIKAKADTHEKQRTAITGPMNAALKAVNALFGGPAGLLEKGEAILKRKMLAWDQAQARIAAEARRKAEEAAALERQRLADEAAARQKEADAQARAAVAAQEAGDAHAASIAQAAAQRAAAEAQTISTTAQMVVAAPVATAAPTKVKGISTSTKLDFEVIDLHRLIVHVAAHPELVNLLAADSVKLRAYVKGLGTACQLPGVRVFEDQVMAARAA